MTDGFAELRSAYEGIDDPGSFADDESLSQYRVALLERTAPQADFLARRLPAGGRVLEIACGNGRLLIQLARLGATAGGLGIDIAESRVSFAQRWAAEDGHERLEFAVGDVLEYSIPQAAFTGAFAITGAFSYFEPVAAGAASRLVEKLHAALVEDGLLCLEIYPHSEHRRLLDATGGRAKIWTELSANDPWRFYLSDLSLNETGDVLTHEKIFIHRATGEVDAGRRERLRLYDEASLEDVLTAAGFRQIEMYEDWGTERYRGGENLVVTARA